MTKEPFISHSEITNEIYIVCGTEKYLVTEQVIKAMQNTGRLEQQPSDDETQKEKSLAFLDGCIAGLDASNKIVFDNCVSRADLTDKLETLDKMYGLDFGMGVQEVVDYLLEPKSKHTCKDCKNYRFLDSDEKGYITFFCGNLLRNNKEDFCCVDFEKRGNEE